MKIYLTGGAVRDKLLGHPPKDFDYVVLGATPGEMLNLGFTQVGASFPVFLHPTTGDEYALARRERKVGEGYLGFECEFGPDITLETDLARRDLSINAIAYDELSQVYYDPCGGRGDIERKILRHASSAFTEDPLRVIRLARFAARYSDFTIAVDTMQLCRQMVLRGDLDSLPAERYWAELHKVFVDSPNQLGRFIEVLIDVGAIARCTFFRDVLGTERIVSDYTWVAVFLDYSNTAITDIARRDTDLAVAVFIALYGFKAALSSPAVPNRVHQLCKNWRMVVANTNTLYDMLTATRSLSGASSALSDLVECLRASRVSKFCNLADDLVIAATISGSINAQPYMQLSGKEIGQAIKRDRLAALAVQFGV